MLHEAYAPLAARGMRFVASHQDSNVTRRRMARGETVVAQHGDLIVGVVTLKRASESHGSPFYEQPEVAGFGQFAVRPSHQGRGIGAMLLRLIEQRASELGVRQLALDTSEKASDLIALYQAKGFTFVEYLQWPEVNYRSVVLAKRLV
jgi:GNAT superfamily N-acetyltransferase